MKSFEEKNWKKGNFLEISSHLNGNFPEGVIHPTYIHTHQKYTNKHTINIIPKSTKPTHKNTSHRYMNIWQEESTINKVNNNISKKTSWCRGKMFHPPLTSAGKNRCIT